MNKGLTWWASARWNGRPNKPEKHLKVYLILANKYLPMGVIVPPLSTIDGVASPTST